MYAFLGPFADELDTGDYVTVLGPPVSTGGLATPEVPARALFVAGGVGTPRGGEGRCLAGRLVMLGQRVEAQLHRHGDTFADGHRRPAAIRGTAN